MNKSTIKPETVILTAGVAILCVIVVAVISSTFSAKANKTKKKLVASIEEFLEVKEQLNICKRNIATFKNLDEKNISDIESYIQANYKRVSTTVAKEIAIKTVELASKYGIAVPILVGMMEIESNFFPHAVSPKQARGLMQVRWKIWEDKLKEELGFVDHYQLHHIEAGIVAGIVVFKYYMAENDNNISKALYAYVGQDKKYVTKVYSAMGKFVLHGVSTIPQTEKHNAKGTLP